VNEHLYGKRYTNRDIVMNNLDPPASARRLISLLNRYSARQGR